MKRRFVIVGSWFDSRLEHKHVLVTKLAVYKPWKIAVIVRLPSNISQFDESFADYKNKEKCERGALDDCPVCGNERKNSTITCSRSCAAKTAGNVDWAQHDVVQLIKEHGSYSAVCDKLGVTGAAVSRRLKKLTTGKY